MEVMASNANFTHIVDYLKGLSLPSETAIAICCNIRAESGATFNPKVIQVGSSAPPFTKDGQGYGLFQFSMFPSNQQIYNYCLNISNNKAIEYQIDKMMEMARNGSWFNSVNYPKFNLSFNEFLKNTRHWSVRDLTFAFMRQYERPLDQEQDRYNLHIAEIKSLYDWSKYDDNGDDNTSDGDKRHYMFDCGGKPIGDSDGDGGEEPPPVKPKPPSDLDRAYNEVYKRYQNKQKGYTNSAGYQCVALMQGYLKSIGGFKDGYYAGALGYANAFRSGLKANKKVMGLKPSEWMWLDKGTKKKGDIIFYAGNSVNRGYGHVNIAMNSTDSLNQNLRPPYLGGYPYIEKAKITSLGSILGFMRKYK